MDDTVFIGGPEKRAIVIEEYDPAWAARFEQVKASLAEALGPKALQIEHFGSTSVPGLGAKGIIDVLVEVEDVDDEAAYGPALESHGFAIRVRQPGHRMYRTPEQDVHVHVFTTTARRRGSASCSATGCATTPPIAASTRRPSGRWRARSGRRRTTTPTPRAPWWPRSSSARSAGPRPRADHRRISAAAHRVARALPNLEEHTP